MFIDHSATTNHPSIILLGAMLLLQSFRHPFQEPFFQSFHYLYKAPASIILPPLPVIFLDYSILTTKHLHHSFHRSSQASSSIFLLLLIGTSINNLITATGHFINQSITAAWQLHQPF
jgi:hypothetical protein